MDFELRAAAAIAPELSEGWNTHLSFPAAARLQAKSLGEFDLLAMLALLVRAKDAGVLGFSLYLVESTGEQVCVISATDFAVWLNLTGLEPSTHVLAWLHSQGVDFYDWQAKSHATVKAAINGLSEMAAEYQHLLDKESHPEDADATFHDMPEALTEPAAVVTVETEKTEVAQAEPATMATSGYTHTTKRTRSDALTAVFDEAVQLHGGDIAKARFKLNEWIHDEQKGFLGFMNDGSIKHLCGVMTKQQFNDRIRRSAKRYKHS